ncbi:hydrogenase [Methyloprofundus sedimenti]|uniref:Hydrogenase n=1 Tax=Methyloprofundus sedimenti TaxID=1420851 RepID=A0A1V8M214_9GAMM|nr:nitrogen fixation protein NifQ [Methyloprofundus sedimenti]OQK15601.1 hydrogenase [Methyloprofundus sedimenti]
MTAVLQFLNGNREHIYDSLLADQDANPNRQWLAKILASWLTGKSVLPDYLGLEPAQFALMQETYFPHVIIPESAPSGSKLDYARMLEKEDLVQLLLFFSPNKDIENGWIIDLVVSACLGSDHLWQDIGFWQRKDLSAFLAHNFPHLAERNNKDMKWKKFLYKQLCEAEGLYLCRAPSCEVCVDYSGCFGSEE